MTRIGWPAEELAGPELVETGCVVVGIIQAAEGQKMRSRIDSSLIRLSRAAVQKGVEQFGAIPYDNALGHESPAYGPCYLLKLSCSLASGLV